MPCTRQLASVLSFNRINVTNFLKDWEIKYEEYGLQIDIRKYKKLLRYCIKDIKECKDLSYITHLLRSATF